MSHPTRTLLGSTDETALTCPRDFTRSSPRSEAPNRTCVGSLRMGGHGGQSGSAQSMRPSQSSSIMLSQISGCGTQIVVVVVEEVVVSVELDELLVEDVLVSVELVLVVVSLELVELEVLVELVWVELVEVVMELVVDAVELVLELVDVVVMELLVEVLELVVELVVEVVSVVLVELLVELVVDVVTVELLELLVELVLELVVELVDVLEVVEVEDVVEVVVVVPPQVLIGLPDASTNPNPAVEVAEPFLTPSSMMSLSALLPLVL